MIEHPCFRWKVLILTACLTAGVFAADAPRGALPGKRAVPSPAEVTKSTQKIRQIFSKEFASTNEGELHRLATELMRQGRDASNDAALRYALYMQAHEVAKASRDIEDAYSAVGELSDLFEIDAVDLYCRAAIDVAPTWKTPEANRTRIDFCFLAIDLAIAGERFDHVKKLLPIAEQAAEKAKDLKISQSTDVRLKRVRDISREYDRARPALVRLKQLDKITPETYLAAGRWYALVLGQHERGAELLKSATINDLTKLFADEATAKDPGAANLLAQRWSALAKTESDAAKPACRLRAAYWAGIGAAGAKGLAKEEGKRLVAEANADALPGGPVASEENPSKSFKVYRVQLTWQTARNCATLLNASLAKVQSAAEMEQLASLAQSRTETWLGAVRQDAGWAWTDGSTVEFTAWRPREPTNAGGRECVVTFNEEGKWNDWNVYGRAGMAVQWPALPNKVSPLDDLPSPQPGKN